MAATTVTEQLLENFQFLKTGKPEEYRLNCPFCTDSKQHLYFNSDKCIFNCFRCGESGQGLVLLAELEGKPIQLVRQRFKKNPTKFVPVSSGTLQEAIQKLGRLENRVRIPSPTFAGMEYPKFYHPFEKAVTAESAPFWEYLRGRGVTDEDVLEYQLGYCVDGPYRNRVILPVFMDGILVGYQGRDITGRAQPKTLNPFGFNKARSLFNYDQASKFDEVVVAEGPFGALRIGKHAVATLGKLVSDDQITFLEPFRRITVLLDSDAWEAAQTMADKFKNPNVFIVFLKSGQPDDYTREELQGMVSSAVRGHSLSSLANMLATKFKD